MGPRIERFHGTLASWNDDRGFGFISAAEGTEKTFVHITSFQARPTRPQVGEPLSFEMEYSVDGKRRATRVRTAGERMSSTTPRRAPRGKSGGARYLAILAFVIGYLVVNAVWPIPLWAAALYLVASIVCFIVYAADKSAAVSGRWRVSESTLLLLGVAGGWPGAIVAQQTLRHKTQKASFRSAFWGSVVLNLIVFVGFTTPLFSLFVDASRRPLG
jgi:uncharacterized membrane protein YsdA (DUF1294 family)/cold shock CspA family protein